MKADRISVAVHSSVIAKIRVFDASRYSIMRGICMFVPVSYEKKHLTCFE